MLNAKYRFHSRGGVQATLRVGRVVRGEKMSVVWVQNRRDKTRFGVVISKKVLKSAVGRNRVRRRVYEVVREWLKARYAQDGAMPKIDALVMVQSAEYREMPHERLHECLWALLEKIG